MPKTVLISFVNRYLKLANSFRICSYKTKDLKSPLDSAVTKKPLPPPLPHFPLFAVACPLSFTYFSSQATIRLCISRRCFIS